MLAKSLSEIEQKNMLECHTVNVVRYWWRRFFFYFVQFSVCCMSRYFVCCSCWNLNVFLNVIIYPNRMAWRTYWAVFFWLMQWWFCSLCHLQEDSVLNVFQVFDKFKSQW